MAQSYDPDLGADLRPLGELDSYSIEKGDPDPRGYQVTSHDGRRIGRVEDLIVDTSAMKVRYLLVDLADDVSASAAGRTILLPTEGVELQDEAGQVIAHGYTGQEAAYTRSAAVSEPTSADRSRVADQQRTLLRTEEELHVGKREVSRGEARVGKHVETERVSQPVTRRREELVVERRPVEAGARGSADISEDEIRVPLMEEELVVEKRPVVKEELVVGKRVVAERDTVETDLRREEFDIDPDTPVTSRGRNRRNER
jgi:uncharacterized protein (TIGR02271 family)